MIPSRRIFNEYANEYDQWFDEHDDVYQAQLRMFRTSLPHHGRGLEVGVGSGRFAAPFGICCGIDPSRELTRIAKSRGIEAVIGEGEHLPYRPGSFDYVLMMTVICFLDNAIAVFQEVNRVLRPGGILVVGFIEDGGKIQRKYQNESKKGKFLQFAKFRTPENVDGFFKDNGFARVSIIERTSGFCVMQGKKPWNNVNE